MTPLARSPLLHFLVLGSVLFGVRQFTADGRALGLGAEPIVVSTAEVERLRAEWRSETRREPTRRELEAAIRRHADDEALLREALRLGLDRSDPVVRTRLVRNLRFARGDAGADADESVLLAEALALGMARHDVVARRRLVQAMEERLAASVDVTAADVRDYIAAHAGRYAAPRRISFEQVFVSADRAALAQRSAEIGGRLAREPVEDAAALGDAFLEGARFAGQSQADLARLFGAAFASAAMRAPVGAWTGPIRSPYGDHFLRVSAVEPARPADVEAVQRQARYALLEQREREAVATALVSLRRAYPVRVEWPALAMAGRP